MHTFVRKLDAEIKATGARTVFFMTWAHRDKPTISPRTYLTARVFYATLTRHNPYGLSNGGLRQVTLEDAHFLQRIAWETVTRYQGGSENLK
jgi:hypothetical protein